MIAFLGAKLISGIQNLIEVTQIENIVKDCDLIITGEGKIDDQTEKGKVISGVSNLARNYKKQIIAVCGYADKNASKKLGLKKVYTILERSNSINDAIVNAEKYLIEIGSEIIVDI